MRSVQTFSGRHINVSPDDTIEMSADDAQYLIRAGWTKLAEWTRDEAQMLGAHLGRLRIVKVALDAPQPSRIRRVG